MGPSRTTAEDTALSFLKEKNDVRLWPPRRHSITAHYGSGDAPRAYRQRSGEPVNAANNTSAQLLTGSAEDGTTMTIYDNGTQVGTTTTDPSTGAWSFLVGQLPNGSTHSYTVTATDAANNVSQPSAALNFVVDTTAPTVAVSIDNTDVNVANPTGLVTFTFSKPPTDFSLNDVTSADGSLSNLSGSGTTYTATFTANPGVDDNAATVSVINGSYHDAAGNAGNGAASGFQGRCKIATLHAGFGVIRGMSAKG
jgi:hypothetical protein